MAKKDYKDAINQVISANSEVLVTLEKRAAISFVFDNVTKTGLIQNYKEASLYNTIYYFLRKQGYFDNKTVNYRFDSIKSKLKFLDDIKSDMSIREYFYDEIFFDSTKVLEFDQTIINNLRDDDDICTIADSKKGKVFDCFYTYLYFRDLKRLLAGESNSTFVKRSIGDQLYDIFDNLYTIDDKIKELAEKVRTSDVAFFHRLITEFYFFLTEIGSNGSSTLYSRMIKNVNAFKTFLRTYGMTSILEMNKSGFFDNITLANVVYSRLIHYLGMGDAYKDYRSIHYLIDSICCFVYIKFYRKLGNFFDTFTSFFDSETYFMYTEYMIKYYELFTNEISAMVEKAGYNFEKNFIEFEIVFKYMIYNKFRNLINSSIKRYIHQNIEAKDLTFVDISELKETMISGVNAPLNESSFHDSVNMEIINAVCSDVSATEKIDMDDLTNITIDYFNGCDIRDKYGMKSANKGKKLAKKLKENIV